MTTVTVDPETGEIRDIDGELPEERALTVRPPAGHIMSGVGAIARLSDTEFEANLAAISVGVRRAARMQEALLIEGTDFGKVPGIARPFLHKPGAEKFEKAFGLATRFALDRMTGDGTSEPSLQFIAHAYVHLGDFDGPIVGEGIGEANSWETKFRYRKAERVCPACGKPGIRWVAKRSNYWHPADAKPDGGCGGNFDKGDARIEDQDTGTVDNPDPWDLANTLAKMATKRAHVDGILRATGTSGLFTQDDDSPAVRPPQPNTPAPARSSSRAEAVPDSPAPKSGAGEPVPQGIMTIEGRAAKGGNAADAELRQTPTGFVFGFSVVESTGQKVQVLALDDLAESLFAVRDELLGSIVSVTGELFRVPWEKDGRAMPMYRQLIAQRVDGPGEDELAAIAERLP